MTSMFSWQTSISLCPASFYTPKGKFACYSRCFLTFYFCILVPYNEHLFWVLVLEGLVGLHRTVHFSFFSIAGRDIDLDYCDIEWFVLKTNRDHSVIFEMASKYCISDSFVACSGCSISSKEFLPTVVDIMVNVS